MADKTEGKTLEEMKADLVEMQKKVDEMESKKVVAFPKNEAAPVVDAEFTEPKDAEAPQPDPNAEAPVLMVYLGYTNKGNIIFHTEGDVNLLSIDGLLKYAERKMADVWRQKEFEYAQAMQKAEEEKKAAEENKKEE
jgi:hypothetical protein